MVLSHPFESYSLSNFARLSVPPRIKSMLVTPKIELPTVVLFVFIGTKFGINVILLKYYRDQIALKCVCIIFFPRTERPRLKMGDNAKNFMKPSEIPIYGFQSKVASKS
jgi:hypothetical protein